MASPYFTTVSTNGATIYNLAFKVLSALGSQPTTIKWRSERLSKHLLRERKRITSLLPLFLWVLPQRTDVGRRLRRSAACHRQQWKQSGFLSPLFIESILCIECSDRTDVRMEDHADGGSGDCGKGKGPFLHTRPPASFFPSFFAFGPLDLGGRERK